MYSVVHSLAATASKPQMVLTGSATLQVCIYDIVIGTATASADDMYRIDVFRFTDVGVGGSALTEDVIPSHAPASGVSSKGGTWGTDPTPESSRSLHPSIFNHRAGSRSPLDPRYPIKSKCAANNGVGTYCSVAGGSATIITQLKFFNG